MTVALSPAMLRNYSHPAQLKQKKKNLFQTLEQQDEVEIEQEIKEVRALLGEGGRDEFIL